MKIRTQFIFSILVFGILIVGMSASAIIIQQRVNRIINQENIVNNVSQETNDLSYLGNNYIIYQESQQLSAWQNEYTLFLNDVTRLQGNTAEEKSLIGNIQADVPQLKSVFDSVVSGLGNQSLNPGGTIDNNIFQISWGRMSVQNQELESDSANLSHLFDTQANRTRQFSIIILIALIALFGVYFLLNYLMIERRTLKSIAKLKAGTVAIGAGNLDYKIEEKEHNEIGELSHSFNLMTTNLKNVTASKIDLEREMTERKKAEESLQESEKKYRTLFENMSEGFALCQMIYDTDGQPVDYRFITVNPAMEKFIGLPHEQIVGNTIRAIMPNAQSKAIENFGRVAATGEQVHFENFSRDLNRWFDIYAYQIKPGQFGFMTMDITDRKQAEDAIKTTLNRFYTILSKMPLGILLVTGDGLTEFANQTFCDMFDLRQSPEEVKNLSAIEVIKRIQNVYLNPEQAVARITEIVNQGEILKDEEVPLQGGRVVLRDFVPIWLGENKYGRLWIHRDMTERKQMEDALKDSEAKANALIKYAPTGIYEIDYRNQRFLSINDAMSTLSGYSKEELFAIGPAAMLDDASKKLFAERVRRQLAGEKLNDSAEYRVRKKDGTLIWVTLNIAFSPDNPDKALVIGHDITVRVEAEKAVQESEEKFSKIFHSSPVGLIITQLPEGRWVEANDSYLKMLGYTREEVIGRTSSDLNLYPDHETRDRIFGVLSENGKIYNQELRLRTKSGRIIQTLSSAEKITISGQEHTLSTNVDITARKQAEAEITHLASFPDLNPNPVLEVETDGKVIYANPAAKTQFPLVTPGLKHQFLTDFINSMKKMNIDSITKDVKIGDSWYEETMALSSSTKNYMLYARDVTTRKNAEVALQETGDYLNNLLNYANAPIIVWDPSFQITQFNHAFEHLTGRSAGEVTGKSLEILFPEEQREHSMEHIRRAVAGERMEGEEISIQRKDGSVRTVLWNSATLYDRDNKAVTATIAQGQDITARKEAENALKESEEKYRDLFENMVEEVHFWKFVRDDDGEIKTWRLVDANPPALRTWGRQTVDEIRGKTTDEIFGPGSTEHFMPVVQKIMTEGIPYAYEDFFPNLNKYFRFTSVPLGEYFITTGSDITEIKQNEESLSRYAHELEASNKELEAFSYSVSHDLRAPLRSITGFSNVLLEDYHDKLDTEAKSYLKRISDAGELMGQLMDDLLKLSRVTRSALTIERVDLSDMARKVVDELRKDEPQRKIKVTIAPDMPADGDRNLLSLVLQNLLGNAWKYSSKTAEPRIEMGTINHKGKRAFFIRDNGVGFDMTYANKLFQPFQRLHKASEFEGTGIGLATVQRIIRRHGGEVWAEAKVGEGATFYFTLS